MEKDGDASQISSSKESIDITKGDTDTSASTDMISQLLQNLVFLRKDFNDSIQLSNQKWDDENSSVLDKISTLHKSTDFSLYIHQRCSYYSRWVDYKFENWSRIYGSPDEYGHK